MGQGVSVTTPIRFVAKTWGYTYEWQIDSPVLKDTGGRPFVWATPVRPVPNENRKRGRLRARSPWYLSHLPPGTLLPPPG